MCDVTGCPAQYREYGGKVITGIVYNSVTKQCEMCQDKIKYTSINCTSCTSNGAGRCDPSACPAQYRDAYHDIVIGVVYSNITRKCDMCQKKIGDYDIKCESCSSNGAGKCDPSGCIEARDFRKIVTGIVYNKISKQCEMCQVNIAGHMGWNCASCTSNGAGRCDAGGCPALTHYTTLTQTCEDDTGDMQCKILLLVVV